MKPINKALQLSSQQIFHQILIRKSQMSLVGYDQKLVLVHECKILRDRYNYLNL